MASANMIKEELKIARWIKFMRVTEHAMTRLFTKKELDQINEEAQIKVLAFDENNKEVIVINDTGLGNFVDRAAMLVSNISRHAT